MREKSNNKGGINKRMYEYKTEDYVREIVEIINKLDVNNLSDSPIKIK